MIIDENGNNIIENLDIMIVVIAEPLIYLSEDVPRLKIVPLENTMLCCICGGGGDQQHKH